MVLGFTGFASQALIGVVSALLLVFAAEVVVGKMESVAKYYGISEVVIAVTIVSIGTSLPEIALHFVGSIDILLSSGAPVQALLVDPVVTLIGSHAESLNLLVQNNVISAEAANSSKEVFRSTSGTVMGASIGSDVVQETLVIGLVIISSAVLAGKQGFRFTRKFLIRDYAPMMATTLITLILALNWKGVISFLQGGTMSLTGTITRLDGILLVTTFLLYMYYLYTTRDEEIAEQGDIDVSEKPRTDFLIGLIAMAGVVGFAQVFLEVVEVAVVQTGLSGSMIGVATVGVVSAFPEMITAISGMRHGSEGVSLGTLVGSNVTNPLLAIGGGAVISSYAASRPLILWDLPMETVLAGLPVLYMLKRDKILTVLSKPFRKIGWVSLAQRMEDAENYVLSIGAAVVLILLYFFYLYVRFRYFPVDFIT
jgi:cation:H+ antiporter